MGWGAQEAQRTQPGDARPVPGQRQGPRLREKKQMSEAGGGGSRLGFKRSAMALSPCRGPATEGYRRAGGSQPLQKREREPFQPEGSWRRSVLSGS